MGLRIQSPGQCLEPLPQVAESAPGYSVRSYESVSGQGFWLSRDPIGVQGGANIYAFVGNNPVSRIDRLGLQIAEPAVEMPVEPPVEIPETFNTDVNYTFEYNPEVEINGEGGYTGLPTPDFGSGTRGGGQNAQFRGPRHEPAEDDRWPVPDPFTLTQQDQTTSCNECKFKFEHYDRGAGRTPAHTQLLAKYFLYPLEIGVVVTAPDGEVARYDAGSPYPTPHTVAEAKTGRVWSWYLPKWKWSPRNNGTFSQDSGNFAKQASVAKKCKLNYIIIFDNDIGRQGYQKHLPQFSQYMQ